MKKIIFFGMTNLVFLSSIAFAQVPNPVADNEMRDVSSIRRRAIELERVKRESNKLKPRESTEEQEIKFAEIKEDFENIQKLQDEIVKAYTTGKKINYEKISQSAAEMTKKTVRLDANLFDSKIEETVKNKDSEKAKPKIVRDLIIELDKVIGTFVSSPVFKNTKLVDEQSSEKSRLDLEKIFRLSDTLSREAKKLQ
jgi:cell fate (sporulation/competence/biofilm development) regulator YlbF (YheA/YmcA/DUF963 family)